MNGLILPSEFLSPPTTTFLLGSHGLMNVLADGVLLTILYQCLHNQCCCLRVINVLSLYFSKILWECVFNNIVLFSNVGCIFKNIPEKWHHRFIVFSYFRNMREIAIVTIMPCKLVNQFVFSVVYTSMLSPELSECYFSYLKKLKTIIVFNQPF